MTNSVPFKHKQGCPGGLQGRKLQGRQIDGSGWGRQLCSRAPKLMTYCPPRSATSWIHPWIEQIGPCSKFLWLSKFSRCLVKCLKLGKWFEYIPEGSGVGDKVQPFESSQLADSFYRGNSATQVTPLHLWGPSPHVQMFSHPWCMYFLFFHPYLGTKVLTILGILSTFV